MGQWLHGRQRVHISTAVALLGAKNLLHQLFLIGLGAVAWWHPAVPLLC